MPRLFRWSSGISPRWAEYCRVDNTAFRILKRNLPGPFTFVLTASSRVPDKALERRRTIGIRIPDNAVSQAPSSPPWAARSDHHVG